MDKSRVKKIIIRIGLGILGLILFLAVGITILFNQNEKEFVNQLTAVYNEFAPGTLSYDDVIVKNWASFPNSALEFRNLSVIDTSTIKHKRFQAEKVGIYLSFESILKNQIQIKSVVISNATLSLDDYSPLTEEEIQGDIPVNDSLVDTRSIFRSYFKKNANLEIEDLQINITIPAKNKFFGFKLKKFNSLSRFQGDKIIAESEMDVDLQALGFNLARGTFGNGAQLSGQFNSVLDMEIGKWDLEPFDLQIDDQVFKLDADFILKKQIQYSIVFENEETQYMPSVKLLSKNIAEKLELFNLTQPLKAKVSLDGRFVYKGNPVVQVDFEATDNQLMVNDSLPIDLISLKGHFVNRFYDDERAVTEELKNFRVSLEKCQAAYRGLDFEVKNLLISTGPEAENQIRSEISSGGSPSEFNNILPDQLLSFNRGNYDIFLQVEGDLATPAALLERASGHFNISNTVITNNYNGVTMPVNFFKASIDNNRARIEGLEIPLNNSDNIEISGSIANISRLVKIQDGKSSPLNLVVSSDNLVWADFLALYDIGEQDPNKTKKGPQQVLRESLIAIYQNYEPTVELSLKNFHYRELHMRNLKAGVYYDNQHLMKLDETRFDVDGGQVVVNAALQLGTPGRVGVTGQLDGSGDISFLQGVFEKEVFTIQNGRFDLTADIRGNLMRDLDVMRQSSFNFNVENSEFLYKPQNIVVPVKNIHIDFSDNKATLHRLRLGTNEEDELEVKGSIENYVALLFERARGKVSSKLNLYSSHLAWDDFLVLFEEEEQSAPSLRSEDKTGEGLKKTLQDIYVSIDPEFQMQIDEFKYTDDIIFRNLRSTVRFDDENTLQFKDTGVAFGETGDISLNADIDISREIETPIALELEAVGDPDDLALLFNESSFSMLGGKFDLKTKAHGDIMKIDQLIANSESHLVVENSSLYHEPSGVQIPCDVMDIELNDNVASLNNFTAALPSGHKMKFSGQMKNVSYLFLKDLTNAQALQSDLVVESEDLVFDEFIDLFELDKPSEEESPIVLKEALKDFYRRFQPSLKIDIKNFTYDQLRLQNLISGFYFENENQFYLESTAFDFYEGKVGLDAHFDLTDPHITSFAFGFNTEVVELDKLLESFEYFGMPSLKEAKKITGITTLNSELEGIIVDSTGMDVKSMKGQIDFEVKDLRVVGFKPLIDIAKKVFKEERFEDIRFQPIKDTLYLSEATLEIPMIEIQSTAIQLFVIGHLGFEDAKTNLWTAIPLSNFKSRDLKSLPDKKGFIESGNNVYIEGKSDKDGTVKYVLHLNPKKYYQERGLISNYRKEIKEYRQQRRQYKRESRRAERENKKQEAKPDSS